MTPPDSDITYGERSEGIWIGGPMELLPTTRETMSLTGESLGRNDPRSPRAQDPHGRIRGGLPEPPDQPAS